MTRMTFSDSGATYTRISKREAVRMYTTGQSFAACPVKLRPGFPFAPHIMIHPDETRSFDQMINSFKYYNCSHETGYYPAFYRVTER